MYGVLETFSDPFCGYSVQFCQSCPFLENCCKVKLLNSEVIVGTSKMSVANILPCNVKVIWRRGGGALLLKLPVTRRS